MPSTNSKPKVRQQSKILAGYTNKIHETEVPCSSLESVENKAQKPKITGIKIIGDSLSDAGRKYRQKFFGIIPCRWFLHKSKKGEFTDEDVWAVYFLQELKVHLDKLPPPYKKIKNL